MRASFLLTAALAISLMQGCVRQNLNPKESEMAEAEKPKVNLKFIFSMCNDVQAMSRFYTELLGMKEQAFYKSEDNKFGYLSYFCEGGLYLMFFSTDREVPKLTEWAWQPGYDGGKLHVTSWAIEIPESDFASTVKRLKEAGVKAFGENPEWRQNSYWGFSVMDPQGNTVEVYTMPKEKPQSPQWPAQ